MMMMKCVIIFMYQFLILFIYVLVILFVDCSDVLNLNFILA